MIKIIEVKDKKTLQEFIEFPYRLYRDDPHWVPPLRRDIKFKFSRKNPFLEYADIQPFIAIKDNSVVGRITAIHNRRYAELTGQKMGFFGFFDSIDDRSVAEALIDRVKEWLRGRDLKMIRGPMNFTSNDEWGVLINGFDEPPMIMMPYNFRYYDEILRECGMQKAKDLLAYIADVPERLDDKVYRVADIFRDSGLRIRQVNKRDLENEMKIFKEVYDSAWSENWGFMPMTDKEIKHMASLLRPFIIPELTLIAERENGDPIGILMLLPNLNFVLKRMNGRLLPFGIFKALWYIRQIKDARLLLFGIKKGARRRGIDALFLIEGLKGVKKRGFKRVELSWILEDNMPIRRTVENLGGKVYKRYRVYECEI